MKNKLGIPLVFAALLLAGCMSGGPGDQSYADQNVETSFNQAFHVEDVGSCPPVADGCHLVELSITNNGDSPLQISKDRWSAKAGGDFDFTIRGVEGFDVIGSNSDGKIKIWIEAPPTIELQKLVYSSDKLGSFSVDIGEYQSPVGVEVANSASGPGNCFYGTNVTNFKCYVFRAEVENRLDYSLDMEYLNWWWVEPSGEDTQEPPDSQEVVYMDGGGELSGGETREVLMWIETPSDVVTDKGKYRFGHMGKPAEFEFTTSDRTTFSPVVDIRVGDITRYEKGCTDRDEYDCVRINLTVINNHGYVTICFNVPCSESGWRLYVEGDDISESPSLGSGEVGGEEQGRGWLAFDIREDETLDRLVLSRQEYGPEGHHWWSPLGG